ncbi:MAG: hypothetical protein AAFU85_33275, partial [Planctomycetota bacterium]
SDRRAVIFEGGWSHTIRSFRGEQLNGMFRREHKDGTGDIVLSEDVSRDSDGDRRFEEVGFQRIRDAKSVEAMLLELAEPCR